MRRILRKIAANEYAQLGDTSTLTDPAVVDDLIENRQNRGNFQQNFATGFANVYSSEAANGGEATKDQVALKFLFKLSV